MKTLEPVLDAVLRAYHRTYGGPDRLKLQREACLKVMQDELRLAVKRNPAAMAQVLSE